MAKKGVKHLVRCVCTLPQLSRTADPPAHEFVAFSTYDDAGDDFDESYVKCDNCGVIHRVVGVCVSKIERGGRDEMRAAVTLEDVRDGLPPKIAAVLDQNNADLATWQQAAWIVEGKRWGESVVLQQEYIDGVKNGKALVIIGEGLFKVVPFANATVAS